MRRRSVARLPIHAFVLLLAFKAAVPMLASLAASAQGRSVGEICSVYGVSLTDVPAAAEHDMHAQGHEHHASGGDVPVPPTEHSGSGDPAGRHGADHCALTALAALGGADEPVLRLPAGSESPAADWRAIAAPARDDTARWVAGLGHGPPVFS